jgi:acyl transferase domain-containing protein
MNNDGSLKVGYTAPSVEGQAQVIAMAQAMAGVEAETIGYVEAHGTGTPLGDPIEIAALTHAFRARTSKKGFCLIGSVKSNVGHLDSAAGVTGLIKAVLVLDRGQIPPSLHFTQPNPVIDFVNSPFRVNARLTTWKTGGHPRRAGVSSFGIGGTNAHVVLEEAPRLESSGPSRSHELLVLSAKTSSALEAATANLAAHLRQRPDLKLADVAYTLQVGRRAFPHRRIALCDGGDILGAAGLLERRDPLRVFTAPPEHDERPVAFLFPGQGAQYVGMGRELYESEPVFRRELDRCAELLHSHLGLDVRTVLYPTGGDPEQASCELQQTAITQPAMFAIEYALARLWMEWGVFPRAMIGHSIGEYVAACLAEVFSLEDALGIVAARGRLMEQMAPGGMLAVSLSELDVQPLLSEQISLAAVNGPSLTALSGPLPEIDRLASQFSETGIFCRRLRTSHAFHSAMMDPAVWPFINRVQEARLAPPRIPFLSNVTGTWITPDAATNPSYWGRHLRQTVRFSDGLQELLRDTRWILLEVGPGQTLGMLAKQHPSRSGEQIVLQSVRGAQERQPDVVSILNALGHAWLHGAAVDWRAFYAHERRRRIPLPTYPFERQRYWIGAPLSPQSTAATASGGRRDVADWFYLPAWKRAVVVEGCADAAASPPARWLVLGEDTPGGERLVRCLREAGHSATGVSAGDMFAHREDGRYTIRTAESADYEALLEELAGNGGLPDRIIHLWASVPEAAISDAAQQWERIRGRTFYSLIGLAQALVAKNVSGRLEIDVVTTELQTVTGDEPVCAAKAGLLGPCKVIPQELSNIRCRVIDLPAGNPDLDTSTSDLIRELLAEPFHTAVAYRKGRRWLQTFEGVKLSSDTQPETRLRKNGVYLITGGMGAIGLTLAEYLAGAVQARLVLTSRSAFPPRADWDEWLQRGDTATAYRIQAIRRMEESGAEVLLLSADAGDSTQMRHAIGQAVARFGTLNGVIHGAGNTTADDIEPITQTGRDGCDRHFRPKVDGAMVLADLLRGMDLDFVLLLSSLSSLLGGLGFVAYAAANAFMDAFARRQNREQAVPWIAVNWDAWQFAPAAGAAGAEFTAILPREGAEAFARIVARAPQQIAVSTYDLHTRFAQWVDLESVRAAEGRPTTAPAQYHPRPNLSSEYVAPQTATEEAVAEIWQHLLSVRPLGTYDNFFELGGHSLLAIQLVSRLRSSLQVEVPVQTLFEAPTIAALADFIEKDRAARESEQQRLVGVLDFVEGLSEEEVRELLKQQPAKERAGNA